MKTHFLLLPLAALSLSSCVSDTSIDPLPPLPPEPTVQHHYHTRTRRVYVPAPTRRVEESAESFRAVERPPAYSE